MEPKAPIVPMALIPQKITNHVKKSQNNANFANGAIHFCEHKNIYLDKCSRKLKMFCIASSSQKV